MTLRPIHVDPNCRRWLWFSVRVTSQSIIGRSGRCGRSFFEPHLGAAATLPQPSRYQWLQERFLPDLQRHVQRFEFQSVIVALKPLQDQDLWILVRFQYRPLLRQERSRTDQLHQEKPQRCWGFLRFWVARLSLCLAELLAGFAASKSELRVPTCIRLSLRLPEGCDSRDFPLGF